MFDGQVRDATSRVEPIGCRKRRGRADVEARAASAAMIPLRLIRRKIERGQDGAEEQPRAAVARDQVGVLALPAEPGGRRERLFHQRGGIDEDLGVAAGSAEQPSGNRFQPRLDDLVVVIAVRVDRDGAAVRPVEDRERIAGRPVVHAEHDDRAHLGPQRARIAAPFAVGHPTHVAVRPIGQEARKVLPGLRDRVRARDPDDLESMRPGDLGERRLDLRQVAQKSRSA